MSASGASQREGVDPGRVGAGRDHDQRAPGKPAHAIPYVGRVERVAAVGVRDGEVLEDHPVLPQHAVRLQRCRLEVVRDQPDLAAARVHLRGDGGRKAYRVLLGRLGPLTPVRAAVEVEDDPDVRGQRLLERLAHECLVARRKPPVDTVEGVARAVIPHR